MKFVCENCGKEYTADSSLGLWRKDNSQSKGRGSGYSVERFCCYECGKEYNINKIKEGWKHKSKEDIEKISQKKKQSVKIVKCIVCGKEFEAQTNTSPKFCSHKCHMIHKYNLPKSGIRKCETCGKEYYYEQGQGNWDLKNEKIWSTGGENGKGKIFTIPSYKFCCYECGIKHKEKLRKEKNLEKYGRTSPFQDKDFLNKIYEENIENGTQFVSKAEIEIREFVESLGFKTEKFIEGSGNSKDSPRFEIDIYIPEKRIGIEYNGSYFHSINGRREGRITKNYHYNKSMTAKQKDIQLIQIWEDQWKNQQEIIKDVLKARLGILSENSIYARKCEIKEIENEQYKLFCEKYHIQGYHKAFVKLGLFYENKLVQIASFSKCRNIGRSKKNVFEWEWIRGCPASNNSVVGGTSKLFSYFIKKYNPESVLCYADWNLFNGQGYEQCNFKLDGFTGPDKFYVTVHSTKRFSRSPSRYHEFKELVRQKKLLECYGAGSMRFIWRKDELKTMERVDKIT